MLLYKNNPKSEKSLYSNPEFIKVAKKVSNNKIYFYLNVLNEAQNNMKFTNQKRTYLELALVKMSDHIEQISVDNIDLINKLEQRIKELEQKIKTLQIAPIMKSADIQIEEEAVSVEQVRNNTYNYIEIGMIAEVLYNGNVNTKKMLQKKLEDVKKIKKERVLVNTIAQASVVACGNNKAILTLEQTPQCDFVMRREQKKKLLALLNEEACLIDDYYAIPKYIWDDILNNYSQQYKAGIKRPVLNEVYIDVRLYNEEENSESEMKKITQEIFGDLVKFEE
jgi:DNA polymerase-3 subunit gamma/tau